MPSGLRHTFAALRIAPFRVLWVGTLLSFVAFFMSTVVQSVVAFELLGTNRAVGVVVFAQGVAMLLLGPLGGALADRWPKRRVVATGQLMAASVFLTLGVMVATGTLHITALAAGSLLIGTTFAFLGPARQALIVDLVPADSRGNAMALQQVANTGSRVVGPGLAGLLLGWAVSGAAGAYGLMALLYAFSASLLLALPRSRVRPGARDAPVFADVRDGLAYVWGQRRLRMLLVFFVAVIMCGFPFVTVLPGLVENQLGRAAEAISGLYFVSALGALGASLLVAGRADSPRAVPLFAVSAFGFGLALIALSRAPRFEVAAALMFFVGASSGGFQSLSGAVIVRETEPVYVGRVMSLTLLAFAGFGLAGMPVGFLADAIGERMTLSALGGGVLLLAMVFSLLLARVHRETGRSTSTAAPGGLATAAGASSLPTPPPPAGRGEG